MTDDSKPREWWINLAHKQLRAKEFIAETYETRDWRGVNVIEKSAYDALEHRYISLKADIDFAVASLSKELLAENAHLRDTIEMLTVMLESLKKEINAKSKE